MVKISVNFILFYIRSNIDILSGQKVTGTVIRKSLAFT